MENPQNVGLEDLLEQLESIRQSFQAQPGLDKQLADLCARLENRNLEVNKATYFSKIMAQLARQFGDLPSEYPGIIHQIVRAISQATGDACVIRLVSEDGEQQDRLAFHYHDLEALSFIRALINAMPEMSAKAVTDEFTSQHLPYLMPRMPLEVLKQYVQPDYWLWIEQYPITSVMVVGMTAHNRLVGTLSLCRYAQDAPFTQTDLAFMEDLANSVALTIENARLRSEERQRVRELNALQTATAALLTTIDPEIMLAKILDAALSAIPAAEQGFLYLIEKSSGQLEIRSVSGARDTLRMSEEVKRTRDYAAAAAREKRPILIQDTHNETISPEIALLVPGNHTRSAMVAPLVLGAHVFGAVYLGASRPFAFTGADLSLLVSFATTATEALQNAMLYAEVQRLATTDTLTEQYNRRRFFELGYLEIERFHRFGHPLSLIMLDVDNLKDINDTHGHIAGDQVLRAVAMRIHQNIRQVDMLGRYGGDEFAVLLPSTDLRLAADIADRIRRSMEESPVETDTGSIMVSMSLGVAQVDSDSATLSALLERADSALYIAKGKGRNRVEVV